MSENLRKEFSRARIVLALAGMLQMVLGGFVSGQVQRNNNLAIFLILATVVEVVMGLVANAVLEARAEKIFR